MGPSITAFSDGEGGAHSGAIPEKRRSIKNWYIGCCSLTIFFILSFCNKKSSAGRLILMPRQFHEKNSLKECFKVSLNMF